MKANVAVLVLTLIGCAGADEPEVAGDDSELRAGELDTTIGASGRIDTPSETFIGEHRGRLFFLGFDGTRSFVSARKERDLSLDASYGTNGRSTIHAPDDRARVTNHTHAAVLPDGRVLVAGYAMGRRRLTFSSMHANPAELVLGVVPNGGGEITTERADAHEAVPEAPCRVPVEIPRGLSPLSNGRVALSVNATCEEASAGEPRVYELSLQGQKPVFERTALRGDRVPLWQPYARTPMPGFTELRERSQGDLFSAEGKALRVLDLQTGKPTGHLQIEDAQTYASPLPGGGMFLSAKTAACSIFTKRLDVTLAEDPSFGDPGTHGRCVGRFPASLVATGADTRGRLLTFFERLERAPSGFSFTYHVDVHRLTTAGELDTRFERGTKGTMPGRLRRATRAGKYLLVELYDAPGTRELRISGDALNRPEVFYVDAPVGTHLRRIKL